MLNTNFNRLIVKSRLPAPISRWSRFCRGFLAGKTTTLLLAILFAAGLNSSRAQNTWTQKADFGGKRSGAIGFSIGSKGYFGTGYNNGYRNDFWEYDPAANVWTQKADFGGTARDRAVGFSIGSKGYIGTGYSGSYKLDFWEYDPATNAWTQKANVGGTTRALAVGFSIGGKGYMGTGATYTYNYNDFWEYDPAANTWTQKANFGGTARYGAVGFSIGTKGYIGTGYDGSYKNDFWEYDPATNSWTQKANFGGAARDGAVGFSIGSKGYIGTGYDGDYKKDFWEYDPAANTWTQKANFGAAGRNYAAGFSIGSKGYIGTGSNGSNKSDFWEYAPACFGFTFYADADGDGFGSAGNTYNASDCVAPSGYVIDSLDCNDNDGTIHFGSCDGPNGVDDNCNGIIDDGFGTTTFYLDADNDGYGNPDSHVNECNQPAGYVTDNTDCQDANGLIHPGVVEIHNGIDDNCNGVIDDTGIWTQKTNFGGAARYMGVGFSIGSKGYIGTGWDGQNYCNDFWEYDPATDAWTQKANFGGTARFAAVGFSIGSKGYIGTGVSQDTITHRYKDFWEYDPVTNGWTKKANFGGGLREGAIGFSIGNKGYIGTGNDYSFYYDDFWEYDPVSNAWTQKANFGGVARSKAVGFSIGIKGYIGTGSGYKNDFWEYDPATDVWTQKADFGGTPRVGATGFSIGNKGYMGIGYDINTLRNDFWQYDSFTNTWTQKAFFGGTPREFASGFSISNKGYIGTGWGFTPGYYNNNFWEYTSDSSDTSTCAVPSNSSVSNTTSTSAQLNWDAVAGAASYKIRYRVAGTSQWTTKNSNGNSIVLTNLSADTKYTWQVKTFCAINPGLSSDWSAKKKFHTVPLRLSDAPALQTSFQIYPNPAEDHATVQFTLPQTSHVYIKVYDLSGKEIACPDFLVGKALLDAELEWGDHSMQINTNHFSKGIYLVRMISDFGIQNQKLIVQ